MEKKLYIYNTLSRKKELFETSHPEVGLYCCGPTVYNFAHIGNLRTYVFEDILKRTLLSIGYKVKHVVNITDVGHLTSDADTGDDKMEMGAKREGKTVWEIAEYYTEAFMENIRDLNILDADIWPKATDHIPEMIDLVKKIEDNGVAYSTEDGIYFDTVKFPTYCDFAGLDPESLRAGSRVAMGEKKNPTDFALWKFSPKGVKRQMEWDSPWGVGFPGWHIECSAMSLKYLPQPVDIHCGGIDHVRIHHTNEIAQVEAATGKQYVRYWIHGEFLVMDKGKMAKSAGGFITLDTVKERKIDPLAYRLFCFSAHYRSPLTFSWESMENAANSLKSLRALVAKETSNDNEKPSDKDIGVILQPFWSAIYDDLNIPQAMAAVWDILHSSNYSSESKKSAIEEADKILGLDLFSAEPEKYVINSGEEVEFKIKVMEPISGELADKIIHLANERCKARKAKDFAKADTIRDELTNLGVEIRDLPDGITECELKE
ncbi:cysteine--tRNA ligase [Fibrobacterota bacterium]